VNGRHIYPDSSLDNEIEKRIAEMIPPEERVPWPPQAGRCYVCGFDYEPILETHHILPQKSGGSDEPTNLVRLCPNCHRLTHEYMRRSEAMILAKVRETWYRQGQKQATYDLLNEWLWARVSPGERNLLDALGTRYGELYLREQIRQELLRGMYGD